MEDKRTDIIEDLIDKNWPNKKSFAEHINIPYTTLASMLKRGIGNASVNNVIKVCKGLGITTDELEKMAEGQHVKGNNLPELNQKDERDIQKELQKMIDDLNNKNSFAAFDGQSLNELDEEDREILIASLENSLRLAKRIAKEKFTPKKYK